MRALVTGSTGHVGSALVRHLVARGDEVTVLARAGASFTRLEEAAARVHVVVGDLATLDPASGLGDRPVDVVYHLAWSGVTRAERDRPEQIAVNVPASLAVFRAAQALGCSTFVGVGSQAEYGPADEVLDEALPLRPNTAYGIAKGAVATLTRALAERSAMRWVWMRLVATYGPHDTDSFLIPSTIRALLGGETPQLRDGRQEMDYLHVDDAAAALAEVGADPSVSGIFNLASGRAATVRSIAERIRDLARPGAPLTFTRGADGAPPPPSVRADIRRLREATRWSPRVDLDVGLARTVDWYRAHAAPASPTRNPDR